MIKMLKYVLTQGSIGSSIIFYTINLTVLILFGIHWNEPIAIGFSISTLVFFWAMNAITWFTDESVR